MFQEERVTNVHELLEEIGTFLDGAPADKTEQVDWERFPENKKKAQESLDSLRDLFSPSYGTTAACTDVRPKDKPGEITMVFACTDVRPKDNSGLLALQLVCTDVRPRDKSGEIETKFACTDVRPREKPGTITMQLACTDVRPREKTEDIEALIAYT